MRTGNRVFGILGLAVAALAVPQVDTAQAETLRVAVNTSDVANLDPHRATATADKGLVGWMFNALVRFPPGSSNPAEIEPDLAESWSVSDDGLVWTFKLREGVRFHGDWGELSAEDVVYSLKRAADPERSSFAGTYDGFEEITAVDPRTVRVELSYPVPGFLGLVANYHGGNIVSKAAADSLGADFNSKPIGTGPFALTERVTQQHVRLDAHGGYFRGTPKIETIMYRFIPSDSSRELAFTSGELDIIYGKREQRWVETTRRNDEAEVDIFLPGEFRTVHLNRSVKPLDDIKVRKAIAHAIKIDDIVAYVGADVGPKGCSVVPTGYLGEDCSWGYEYDLEKAKALLAQAGHPDGFEITSVVSSNASQLPIMEVIQSQLAAVGIKMNMNVVDHPTYHQQIRQDASAITFYGAARFPMADSYLTQFYHSAATVGTPTAITNFSHCDVADAEIEAARQTADEAERMKLWAQAQQKIHDAVCSVPLFSLLQVWLRDDGLDYGYALKGSMNLAPPITEATTISR
ncbi:polyamine ABC transporter substrate-binding protein [Pelagibius litoralis]|uniref:Polyamine ABC transporter substrate-binding protein n=1 Tax=Pelagibius litoralis TaxID=374515 RepID=A0A967F1M8_9PROT|nr:ABC transporter substrate-binding protein [Pelagibius litoralis]NIA71407.1 polyamine ABC transporter substrate-binding protein [Pelagibius litoralis]